MAITLKAARINANLTQAQAAEMINVDEDTLRSWEQRKTYPNVPQIKKIEEAYGVSYNDIIFLDDTSV